jgi:hypothetical protein
MERPCLTRAEPEEDRLPMRLDTRFLDWGVFFILAGAIPLLVQGGYLDASTVAGWWRFWPLLIVAAGVGLLLRQTDLHFAGGLITAAVFGLMVGGLLGAGTAADFGGLTCSGGTGGTAFPTQTGSVAPGASVDVEFRCGDLSVGAASGDAWSVAGTSHDGARPEVDSSAQGLSVRARGGTAVSIPPFTENGESWQVSVPPSIGSFDLTMNAGSGRVDLGGTSASTVSATLNAGDVRLGLGGAASLSRISMTVNAGSAKLDLPTANVTGSLTVNAGSIEFCVPDGVGLRLTTGDNITGGNNYASQGLTKDGNTWESPDFATAPNKIVLSTTANLGGMTLDPAGGCK